MVSPVRSPNDPGRGVAWRKFVAAGHGRRSPWCPTCGKVLVQSKVGRRRIACSDLCYKQLLRHRQEERRLSEKAAALRTQLVQALGALDAHVVERKQATTGSGGARALA